MILTKPTQMILTIPQVILTNDAHHPNPDDDPDDPNHPDPDDPNHPDPDDINTPSQMILTIPQMIRTIPTR